MTVLNAVMKAYTQIPPGTQILIGRAARRRRVLERAICSVFEGWSYEEIIPPIFDYYDVFAKGMGAGQEEHIYRFIDREGNILALRPEFTSLVAKTVATRLASSPKPIRLFYPGEVLRFEKPKGGRQREFAQIGVEHYGGTGKTADVEILLIAVETFPAARHPGVSDQSRQCGFLRRHRRSHGIAGRTTYRRAQGRPEHEGPVRASKTLLAEAAARRSPQKDFARGAATHRRKGRHCGSAGSW